MGLPSWSFGILEIGTPATFEAHNFVYRPLIEVMSKEKLYPLLRAFQRYVAHHMYACRVIIDF
jgi:hypothetical protein